MLHANPKSKATLDILWAAAEAMVDVKGSKIYIPAISDVANILLQDLTQTLITRILVI